MRPAKAWAHFSFQAQQDYLPPLAACPRGVSLMARKARAKIMEALMPRPSSDGKRIRGRAGMAMRKRRMIRSNWLCEDCKAKGTIQSADVVDHIKPLALGGLDVDENTRNLCQECHEARTAEQFGHRKRIATGLDGWPIEGRSY